MSTISVIVLNYNSSADCCKCVTDLKQQEGVELEIIIVDNCSRTEDALAVEKLAAEQGCTFIAAKENRGYNAGNNIGLRYAANKGYEYALIANPDMEFPQRDFVRRLNETMQKSSDIVACGSDIVTKEGIHQNPKKCGDNGWKNSFKWLSDIFKKQGETNIPGWIANPQISAYCNGLNGCCLMVRLDYLKEIGFFDERVFLYGEETIFARQVELSGEKMYYEASVQAVHNHQKKKEPASAFCLRNWKKSQRHYICEYSHYPFYGKWIALLSLHLYFGLLTLKNKIKR